MADNHLGNDQDNNEPATGRKVPVFPPATITSDNLP